MALTDWQFQVDDFIFGAGTPYGVVSVTGLRGMPDLRSQATPRDGADGLFTGPDRAGGRTIEFTLDLGVEAGASMTDLVDVLAAAMIPRDDVAVLYFREPGRATRQVLGRWRRGAPVIDQAYSLGYTRFPVQFSCDDPHIYGAVEAAIVTMPVGGGVTLPVTMPVVFPGTTGGAQTIRNDGNTTSRPAVIILGPATLPRVHNLTTGEELAVFTLLNEGDTLVADARDRTLKLNGRPCRELLMPGASWITLAPGDNVISFAATATGGGSAPSTVIYYADTWIS